MQEQITQPRTAEQRIFRPFPDIMVPFFEGHGAENAIALAKTLDGHIHLVGLVQVPADESLSGGNLSARRLRSNLNHLNEAQHLKAECKISVSHNYWVDLCDYIQTHKPDLLVVDWPSFSEALGVNAAGILSDLNCDVAMVCGAWPKKVNQALVPVRGGDNAQLALRLALALPHKQLIALHLVGEDQLTGVINEPFRGLAKILPSLRGVNYLVERSNNPAAVIVERARGMDVLLLGASNDPNRLSNSLGRISDELDGLEQPCRVVLKSRERWPAQYEGAAGELAGSRAISVLVDKWFAENTYHASEFDNLSDLVARKKAQNLTISLAIPALNEEATVGKVIETIQHSLMHKHALLDEIVLMDSNSSDRTREIAASLGVPVYIHQEVLAQYGARPGKGEALWKSLYVTRGDIVVWIDSDIVNIHPRFVYGVIGPMLMDPGVQFVKGFYQRPLKSDRRVQSTGGGRVTELTARPLINLFFPDLSGVIQPLSGEYGGRRTALEQLTFYSGYGVETGLLIDVYEKFGLSGIAQVDLLERIHHNQPLEALSKMSFVIIQTFLRKLEARIGRPLLEEVNKTMKLIQYEDGAYYLKVQEVPERERQPIVELPEYREQSGRIL